VLIGPIRQQKVTEEDKHSVAGLSTQLIPEDRMSSRDSHTTKSQSKQRVNVNER